MNRKEGERKTEQGKGKRGSISVLLGVLFAALIWLQNSATVQAAQNGLAPAEDGSWYYYVNDEIDFGYAGLAANESGWWYVENGKINFDYNGLVSYGDSWWCIAGGKVAFEYTGLWSDPNVGWWYVENGTINFKYNGLIPYADAWWCVAGGQVIFDYTGLWSDSNVGWWYVENGTINYKYSGLIPYADAWWCVAGGQVIFDYTGLWNDPNVGWWYVENGTINFGFTGIVTNDAGAWYCRGGQIAFDVTGTVTYNGVTYTVVNGAATPKGNGSDNGQSGSSYVLGTQSKGILQKGIYVIRSAANENYALTVSSAAASEGGYNLTMSPINGGNDQKFYIFPADGSYILISLQYFDNNNLGWRVNAPNFGYPGAGLNDNAILAPTSVSGGQLWKIQETSTGSGIYTIMVGRNDSYQFVLNAEGTVSDGSNVGTTEPTGQRSQQFTFYSPYSKTLEDGIYTISSKENAGYSVSVEAYGMDNFNPFVMQPKSLGTEQSFYITCMDAVQGIYQIKNMNSSKLVDVNTSQTAGTQIVQNYNHGNTDEQWYIQKNTDGTYSFISAWSNFYLSYDGNLTAGKAVVQTAGFELDSQRFYVEAQVSGTESLNTSLYAINGKKYRISTVNNGLYTIYDVSAGKYLQMNSDGSAGYGADGNTAAEKWIITSEGGSNYTIKSAIRDAYLSAGMTGSTSKTNVTVTNIANQSNGYDVRYDLSAIAQYALVDPGLQIQTRLQMLNLKMSDFMNPEASMAQVEANVTNAIQLPSARIVTFTESTSDALNSFISSNRGSIIQLAKDVTVTDKIYIPSNTVLDGCGHSLVLASDQEEAPENGIVFMNYVEGSGFTTSQNAGIRNIHSIVKFKIAVGLLGSDNIVIEDCSFANTISDGITLYMNDTTQGSDNVIIRNNTFHSIGRDAISVAGNHSNIIIEGNQIDGSAGQAGIILGCNTGDKLIRVDKEITGPHDIVVKNNTVSNATKGCAMYLVGTYRVYLTGNTLNRSQLEGICFDGGCIGTYFANNEVTNAGQVGGLPAVSIDNSIYSIVDSNYLHNNANGGVKMVRTGVGNLIVNNTIVDNSESQCNKEGKLSSAGILLHTQELYDTDGDTLDATGSNGNVIIGNKIYGAHDYGIWLAVDTNIGSVKHNTIRYNRITGTTVCPVSKMSSSYNMVVDNWIE